MTKPLDISAAAAALGREGGKSTSERKAAAARENGKRGGRPRKETTMGKIYRTPRAVLNAAQKKLGGRITTYDGTLVLTITERSLSGAIIDNHLSAEQAARKAGLNYSPD